VVVVYDTGRQVLDDGAKIRDFCGYWEILKTHQGELSQAGVDLSGLPMDRSAADFEAAYYKEADINLKVIRESGDHLQDAVTGGTQQVGLIGETERLSQYVKGHAADAAWEKYKTNTEQLQANLQKLKDAQEAVKGVDDNLYFGLNKKQDEYTAAITLMIEGTIQNNPTDFANRLTTGAAAISANNTGVEGSDKHLYAWHGSPGVNWPARQVKDDLRTSVIGAFATAIAAFNDANTSMDQFVTDNYTILRQALNIGENGPQDSSFPKVTMDQLQAIFNQGAFASLPPEQQQRILDQLNAMMEHAGIDTPQRQAAFLATCAIESGELTMWYEGAYPGGPDADWFNAHYGPQTSKGQELGNTEPGDGARFMGRGPIQVTGRSNYQRFTEWYNQSYSPNPPMDFTQTPELLQQPEYGFAAAEWYWTAHGINAAADSGGIDAVTDIVNYYDGNRDKKRDVYQRALSALGG
jgi:predicted chitinase